MGSEPLHEPPPTVVVAASSRGPRNWTVVVIAMLVLAILKPWGGGDSGRDARSQAAPAAPPLIAGPSPTPDLSADGLAEPLCLGPGAWLVASVEQWRTHPVRVWKVIEPITNATGPANPLIPSVPVAAYSVPALGWCAPVWGPLRPVGPATVRAWRIANGPPLPIELRQVAPVSLTTPLGALYGPPGGCAPACPSPAPGASPGPASWLPGRYVFRYEDRGRPEVLWFAVELEQLPPLAEPSASPSAAPG